MSRNKRKPTPLGLVLKQQREAAGLSQEAMAEGLRFHRTNVSQVECLVIKPSFRYLRRFATFMGVDASPLLDQLEAEREREERS